MGDGRVPRAVLVLLPRQKNKKSFCSIFQNGTSWVAGIAHFGKEKRKEKREFASHSFLFTLHSFLIIKKKQKKYGV
jgi:hypothetical protein